ncbi:Rapamycininsensitive companion of mTORlike, partial [Caligus rogercresseyi]
MEVNLPEALVNSFRSKQQFSSENSFIDHLFFFLLKRIYPITVFPVSLPKLPHRILR